jgi:hypothetical protein
MDSDAYSVPLPPTLPESVCTPLSLVMQHGSLDAVGRDTKIYGVAWMSAVPVPLASPDPRVEIHGVAVGGRYLGYVRLVDCSKANRLRPVFFRDLFRDMVSEPAEAGGAADGVSATDGVLLFKIGDQAHMESLAALCAGVSSAKAGKRPSAPSAGKRPPPPSAGKPPRPPKAAKAGGAAPSAAPPAPGEKARLLAALDNWRGRPDAVVDADAMHRAFTSWRAQLILLAEREAGATGAGTSASGAGVAVSGTGASIKS